MPPPRQLSPAQIETLLSFMDAHRDLACCVIMMNPDNKQQVNELWEKLASLLNADTDGVKKSSQAWRRYWNEKKYSVRRKAMEITRNITAGEPARMALSAEETKILDILGRLSGQAGSRPVGLEYTKREPVQDEDSSEWDPIDQSSFEESKTSFNFNGSFVDQAHGVAASTTSSQPKWLTQTQGETLISFMDSHRELASGVLVRNPGTDSKLKVKKLFEKLASILNKMDGAKKSPQGWRRYWNEKKYAVRRKAMEITRCVTAGEPASLELNAEETKILDIMGRLAGKGGSKGPEFDYTIRLPVQDDDSSGLDPLDQSSNEEKFKPGSPKTNNPNPILETKVFNFNGNTADEEPAQSPEGPPQWAVDIEERRTAASERIASCLERLTTAVVGMHQSLQSLTEEVAVIRGALARPP